MTDSRTLRCQKCGNPIGYITVLGRGLMGIQQPITNVRLVGTCMDCTTK